MIVEGGPDLLAAFHLAWCAGVESQIAPVAVLGARNEIPDDALPHFAGKRVRIFPDNDKEGQDAKERWAAQLLAAGADVDSYSFAGLLRADGAPVKDLATSRMFTLINGRKSVRQSSKPLPSPQEHEIENRNISEAA